MISCVVSIHVPAKGTTIFFRPDIMLHLQFQSTFPRRERPMMSVLISSGTVFQSTFPRRERQRLPYSFRRPAYSFNPRSREGNDRPLMFLSYHPCCFNPRSREGNDLLQHEKHRVHVVSIHVPAKGTTAALHTEGQKCNVSIHVPAKGTTFRVKNFIQPCIVSIHVPAKGTTGTGIYPSIDKTVSIHVPAKGTTSCSV